MSLIDLTHAMTRRTVAADVIPVVVRSIDPVHLIPLHRLYTLATVVDLTDRSEDLVITRSDVSRFGVSDIGGCILRTDWCDRVLGGTFVEPPVFDVGAAWYLLEGGVRTVAADFPIAADAADLLLHNNCVLVHCLSSVCKLDKPIVRLIALPLKLEDAFSAESRVIAVTHE